MSKLVIRTGSTEAFFKRGRQIAKKLDTSQCVSTEHIVSFEEPTELVRLMTDSRLTVFKEVKQHTGSITEIAERLRRDRHAVKKDIDALEKAGLVRVQARVLPGLGRVKQVHVLAQSLSVRAKLS